VIKLSKHSSAIKSGTHDITENC